MGPINIGAVVTVIILSSTFFSPCLRFGFQEVSRKRRG